VEVEVTPAELDALEAAVKAMTAGPYVVVEQDGVYWIDSTNPAFDEGREILAEIGWGPNAHAVALLLNRLESILAMARRTEAAEAYATLTRDACRVRLDIRTEERDQFQAALTASRAEVERLRAALSWYAESKNVAPDFHEPEWAAGGSVAKWRPIDEDCGERARAVLAAEVKS